MVDEVQVSRVDKTSWLATVDPLAERAVEEGVIHVELMHKPIARESQRQHCADRGRFDHRAKGLIVVDFRALSEATRHPTCLVAIQGTVSLELVLSDPFVGDNIGSRGARHQVPGAVGDQGIVLFLHSMTRAGVGERAADGGRLGGECW